MSEQVTTSEFDGRIGRLRGSMAASHGTLAVLAWLVVFLSGWSSLAALDYFLELAYSWRLGLGAIVAAGLIALACLLYRSVACRCSLPEAARQMEHQFPELGQRARTRVQYGPATDDPARLVGVSTELVDALGRDADRTTQALDLTTLLPRRRLVRAGVALGTLMAVVVGILISVPEWRTAVKRAALVPAHYSSLEVKPGNTTAYDGARIAVEVEVTGRAITDLQVHHRQLASNDPWSTVPLEVVEPDSGATGQQRSGKETFRATLPAATGDIEYRIAAPHQTTPSFHVRVQRRVRMQGLEADLTPPEFTGIPPSRQTTGSLTIPTGTQIAFRAQFDRPLRSAELVFYRNQLEVGRQELLVADKTVSGRVTATESVQYSISARGLDGTPSVEDRYALRVIENRPARVAIKDAKAVDEVSSIDELPLHLTAEDEFGVSRVGIVYWVNTEEPHELVLSNVAPDGDGVHDQVMADATLFLEQLLLSHHDSVTYCAYAEDLTAEGKRRAHSDLHFLDIRPFRRIYLQGGQCNGGGRCMSLDELIARERSNLRRAFQADTAGNDSPLNAAQIGAVAGFEDRTAAMSRQFAEGAREIFPEVAAEVDRAAASMEASASEIRVTRWPTASSHQRAALHHLTVARNTVQQRLCQGGNASGEFVKFDHRQLQKIRRPADQDELLAQMLSELRRLADTELELVDELTRGNQQLDDRQRLAVAGIEGIADYMDAQSDLSDRAKRRMQSTQASAEDAATALASDDPLYAAGPLTEANWGLIEAAFQLEGQLSSSLSRSIASARSLAEATARAAEDLSVLPGSDEGTQLDSRRSAHGASQGPSNRGRSAGQSTGPGTGAGSGRNVQPGDGRGTGSARGEPGQRVVDSVATLQDLLESLSRSESLQQSPEAQSSWAAMEHTRQLQRIDEMLRAYRDQVHRDPERSQQAAQEAARELDQLAARLDTVHRQVTENELRRLQRVQQLANRLLAQSAAARNGAGSDPSTRDLQELSHALAQIGEHELSNQLVKRAQQPNAPRYRPGGGQSSEGASTGAGLEAVVWALAARIQETLNQSLAVDETELSPAAFRPWIERYFQVISQGPAGAGIE